MSSSPDFHGFKSTEDQSLVNSGEDRPAAENPEEDLTLVNPGRVRFDLLRRQIESIKEGLANSEVEEVEFSLFQYQEQTETTLSKQPTLPLLPPHIPSPCLSCCHVFIPHHAPLSPPIQSVGDLLTPVNSSRQQVSVITPNPENSGNFFPPMENPLQSHPRLALTPGGSWDN